MFGPLLDVFNEAMVVGSGGAVLLVGDRKREKVVRKSVGLQLPQCAQCV